MLWLSFGNIREKGTKGNSWKFWEIGRIFQDLKMETLILFWIPIVVDVFLQQMREGNRGEEGWKFWKWVDFSISILVETRAYRWKWLWDCFGKLFAMVICLAVRERKREKSNWKLLITNWGWTSVYGGTLEN